MAFKSWKVYRSPNISQIQTDIGYLEPIPNEELTGNADVAQRFRLALKAPEMYELLERVCDPLMVGEPWVKEAEALFQFIDEGN